jgi:geranylgeranyl diphosphate synthase type I
MKIDPGQPLSEDFQALVQASLDHFFDTQRDLLALIGNRLDVVWREAAHFAVGGKRMRPAFCYWGYVAAAGGEAPPAVVDVAASMDLLHLSALIHDDLIDGSDTRRGGPAAHRFFEDHHRRQHWLGDSARWGASAAILLGDLLFAWSTTMVEQAAMPGERGRRARPYLDAMRSEVLAGQFLELINQTKPAKREDYLREARLVMDYKSAKYTVARPVQIGAALGGAGDDVQHGLGRFGDHVGRAFQMRDDLLGVFGDPVITGKPTGDDLREGKKTVLIGYALRLASVPAAEQLTALLGNPDLTQAEVDTARQILTECGAVGATERAIETEAASGMKHLHRLHLSAEGTYALMNLVHSAVERAA